MTVHDAQMTIRTRLSAEWTETPVAFPWEEFTLPQLHGVPTAFVRFEPDSSEMRRIGASRLYESSGRVLLVVVSPTTISGADAGGMRQRLGQIFTDWSDGTVMTEIEEDNPDSGKDDSGNYYISYVAIRWRIWSDS